MRSVYIFEKPSALRAAKPFLPPGDVPIAGEGHLLETDIPNDWSGGFEALPLVYDVLPLKVGVNRSRQSHKPKVDALRDALKSADRVVIGTDPGREGSQIAWELLDHLGWKGPVARVKISGYDETSLRRAFEAMAADPCSGEKDYAAYQEALCRQYEDTLLGINGTRGITLRLKPEAIRGVWSFGGVQTPLLGMLADLELRIRNHTPQDYYRISVDVGTAAGSTLTLWHAPKERIFDAAAAQAIRDAATAWSGAIAVEQKDVKRAPGRLFSKATLARRCAKLYGMDPAQTARFAQEAYDAGCATYPRGESDALPLSQMGDAPELLAAIVAGLSDLAPLVPDAGDIVYRKGANGHYVEDPGEHHAIVPTRKVPRPSDLSDGALKVWQLVARSYFAAHLPDAVDARTTASIGVATPLGPKRFSISGTVPKSAGWRAVYGAGVDEEDDVPGRAKGEADSVVAGRLPPVRDGEAGRAAGAGIQTAQTEPPRRVTLGEAETFMARLIDQFDDPVLKAALENPVNPNEPKGLGTAATRDSYIPKLVRSGYVVLLKGKDPPIQVTAIGLRFIAEAVRRVFPSYADPVGRAQLEADLAEIGRASTREEALRRAAAFKERTRTRVRELVAAIGGSAPIGIYASQVPARPPSKPMIKFAESLAQRKGLKLPRGLKTDAAVCRAFLDRHAEKREPSAAAVDGPRAPTAAMLNFARSIAEREGLSLSADIESDFAACKAFLDKHGGGKPAGRGAKPRPNGRGPAASSNRAGRLPTPPMVKFAKSLAERQNLALPAEILASFDACKAFLDRHGARK